MGDHPPPKSLDHTFIIDLIAIIAGENRTIAILSKIMELQISTTHPIPAALIVDLHLCSYPVATLLCQHTLKYFLNNDKFKPKDQLVIICGLSTGSKVQNKGKMQKIVIEQFKPFTSTLSYRSEARGLGAIRISFQSESIDLQVNNAQEELAKPSSSDSRPSYGRSASISSQPAAYIPPARRAQDSSQSSSFSPSSYGSSTSTSSEPDPYIPPARRTQQSNFQKSFKKPNRW